MIIKVCGLTDVNNIEELENSCNIAMVGYNFYSKSKRFLDIKSVDLDDFNSINSLKVGVFVDADLMYIEDHIEAFDLDFVQLHGNESIDFVDLVANVTNVIKAVGIETKEDLMNARQYRSCEYILFDKKSPLHGGTGVQFDWKLLKHYTGETPFLLAGGIGPEDFTKVKEIKHNHFAGVDLNSKFETSAGIKNVNMIKGFLYDLKYK